MKNDVLGFIICGDLWWWRWGEIINVRVSGGWQKFVVLVNGWHFGGVGVMWLALRPGMESSIYIVCFNNRRSVLNLLSLYVFCMR